MGGGGGNIPIGSYGGTQGVFNYGQQPPANQGGFNQAQQNYIQNQGKLPTSFGGDALSQAQQNFFTNKGYLPKGFTGGDLGQQYYRQQPQQQPQYNPYGYYGAQQQPAQQGGFNQAQQSYIQAQGKLPTAFGGGALNQGQQNFFANKGYLPKGFTSGDLGQQYYRQQPGGGGGGNTSYQDPGGGNPNLLGKYGEPGGLANLQGLGGLGGYSPQQLAGSNKPGAGGWQSQ